MEKINRSDRAILNIIEKCSTDLKTADGKIGGVSVKDGGGNYRTIVEIMQDLMDMDIEKAKRYFRESFDSADDETINSLAESAVSLSNAVRGD